MNPILIVAGKEFRDGLRNRWIIAITVIFALLSLGLAYFGAAASGRIGFTSLDTTIISLASLAIYIVPLIALLLAYHTVVGEEEQGTLLLLLSYPLGRGQLLAGKFLGHSGIIGISSLLGFGSAGIVMVFFSGEIDPAELVGAYSYFIVSAMMLGLVFIAFAHLISVLVTEKTRAAGLALLVWFLFVLVFDLALLGVLVATQGRVGADIFPYLLLLNPTDVFRLANLAGFEAVQVHAGLSAIATPEILSPIFLLGILALWIAIPFSFAAWLFARRQA